MHILILADPVDNQKAGVHVYTKNLILALLKIDKKNTYSFIHEKENIFFKNLNHFIIPKKKIPGYGTYRKFHLIPALIKKLQPDIAFETAHIGPFCIPKNTKKAVMIHDLTPILFPELHIKRSAIIHKIFIKNILKNADLIITASQNTKKDILKYSRTKAEIAVIPLGINNHKKFKALKPIENKPYLLYFGTIEPRKNLKALIEAFEELKNKHKIPHKLILAGEIGWKAKKILQKIRKNKDITLTGYLSEEEKSVLYKNADIFIYPSIYEGFGLPPLEAMSHGIPVICSNNSSLKEIFSKNALLFTTKNPEELKKQILKLLKNKPLYKNLSTFGKIFAKNFTWEKTAEKTLKAFEKIFSKKELTSKA